MLGHTSWGNCPTSVLCLVLLLGGGSCGGGGGVSSEPSVPWMTLQKGRAAHGPWNAALSYPTNSSGLPVCLTVVRGSLSVFGYPSFLLFGIRLFIFGEVVFQDPTKCSVSSNCVFSFLFLKDTTQANRTSACRPFAVFVFVCLLSCPLPFSFCLLPASFCRPSFPVSWVCRHAISDPTLHVLLGLI